MGDHYPVVERYVHNTAAMAQWRLDKLSYRISGYPSKTGNKGRFQNRTDEETCAQGIAKYLRSKSIERPYDGYVGWQGDEGKYLIEEGKPHV